MDTLLRFGSGDYLYTFNPDDQIQIRDNFRDLVPRTSKIPGLSGAFDEQGTDIAPTEEGNVQVTFWLLAMDAADMQAKKEAVGRMKTFGKRRLYKQPEDETQTERYCDARINSISFNERAGERPDKYLRVTINFQVPDNPRWLTIGTEAPSYNDGSTYGSGVTYGGSPITQNLVGTDNTFSVTPSGNDISYPRFTIEVPAGKSASNIRLQREEAGVVVDELIYAGTLSAGDILEINCRSYSVWLNGADGYSSDFSFITSAWFRLIGGLQNDFRVLMDNAGDEIDLEIRYYEAYNV